MREESQWEVTINSRWCKKCSLCAAMCPQKVLQMEDGPVVNEPSRCVGCLMCEMHCPDFAITVRRRDQK